MWTEEGSADGVGEEGGGLPEKWAEGHYIVFFWVGGVLRFEVGVEVGC